MENKKNSKLKYYLYAIVPVLSFMSVAFLTSYSFYLASVVGNEDNGDVELKSAQVFALFRTVDDLNVENMLPGYTGQVEFSIFNNSPEENLYGNYTLAWDIESNEIDSPDFIYSLEGTSEKNGVSVPESENNKLVNVTSLRIPSASINIGTGTINTGVTHKYILKIKFVESGTNQNELQGKMFKAKIVAKGDPNV